MDTSAAVDLKLGSAGAILVVWSGYSRGSEYVRSEAATGLYKNKLIQVRIDGAAPPRPFDQVEVVDIGLWSGERDDPNWRKIIRFGASLCRRAGQRPAAGYAPRRHGVSGLSGTATVGRLGAADCGRRARCRRAQACGSAIRSAGALAVRRSQVSSMQPRQKLRRWKKKRSLRPQAAYSRTRWSRQRLDARGAQQTRWLARLRRRVPAGEQCGDSAFAATRAGCAGMGAGGHGRQRGGYQGYLKEFPIDGVMPGAMATSARERLVSLSTERTQAIEEIQRGLVSLKLYKGDVDGKGGDGTARAMRQFAHRPQAFVSDAVDSRAARPSRVRRRHQRSCRKSGSTQVAQATPKAPIIAAATTSSPSTAAAAAADRQRIALGAGGSSGCCTNGCRRPHRPTRLRIAERQRVLDTNAWAGRRARRDTSLAIRPIS